MNDMNDNFELATQNETVTTEAAPQPTWIAWSRIESAGAHLVREIAPAPVVHRCPSCRSIVYSRRHRLCGVCSQPLPESFLFPVSEARRITQLLEAERQQHRRWLAENYQFA